MDKTRSLSVRIEPRLRQWLARVARARRVSEGQLVRELLWKAHDADATKQPEQPVQS